MVNGVGLKADPDQGAGGTIGVLLTRVKVGCNETGFPSCRGIVGELGSGVCVSVP